MNNLKSNKMVSNAFPDSLIKLFILFSVYQFTLHLYFVSSANDPRLILPTSIAFIHDLAILAIVTSIGYLLVSISSIQFKSISNTTSAIILIITGILLSVYPKILREYLVFPVNIFDSDINSAKTLVFDYLGIAALLPCLIALVLVVIIYRIHKELHVSKRIKIFGFIIILGS